MSLSQTQIIGLASDVISLLEHDKEKITLLGIDAERLIRELKQLLEETVESDAKQESLKRATREETRKTVKLTHNLHIKASGTLDIVIGAYGKNSIDSSVIRRIRSRIKRSENHEDSKEKPAPTKV